MKISKQPPTGSLFIFCINSGSRVMVLLTIAKRLQKAATKKSPVVLPGYKASACWL
jgi:hypothetical protein